VLDVPFTGLKELLGIKVALLLSVKLLIPAAFTINIRLNASFVVLLKTISFEPVQVSGGMYAPPISQPYPVVCNTQTGAEDVIYAVFPEKEPEYICPLFIVETTTLSREIVVFG
jgi:hypothetical protein